MRKSLLKKISTLLISVILFSSAFTPVYAGTYDSAELIKAVQNILNAFEFDCGIPDGVIGNSTIEAIKSYQKDQGLPETGEISYELIDRLKAGIPLSLFNKRYNEAVDYWNAHKNVIWSDTTQSAVTLEYIDVNESDEKYQPNNNLMVYVNPNVKDRKMVGNINLGSASGTAFDVYLASAEIMTTFYAFDLAIENPEDAVDFLDDLLNNAPFESGSGVEYDNYSVKGLLLYKAEYGTFSASSISSDYD